MIENTLITSVMVCSILCQLVVAILAVRLVGKTKNRGWFIVLAIIALQIVRRSVIFHHFIFNSQIPDLKNELISLMISLLAIAGLVWIGEYFSSSKRLKENAERFHESDIILNTLVERSNDGIVIVKNDLMQFFNRSFLTMTGYSSAELRGRSFDGLISVDFSRGTARMHGRSDGGGIELYEAQLHCRDASALQVEVNSGSILHGSGPATLYIIHDISRRKKTEDALKRSERLVSNVFRSSPVGIGITTFEEGSFIEINDAALNMLGYARQEVIGRTTTELGIWADPDERLKIISMMRNLEFVQNFEIKVRRKSGEIRSMLFSAERMEFEKMNYMLTMVLDITDLMKARSSLRESEEKYRSLVEAAEDGIVLMDMRGNHLFVNTAYFIMLGYEPGDDPNPTGFDAIHPDDISILKKGLEVLPVKGTYSLEYRIRHRDGHWVYCSTKCTNIRDASDNPHRILAIVRNITEKKKLEDELQKSEKLFSTIFRTSPVGIGISSVEEGRFFEVNDAILKKTGYTREEMIGRTATELGLWVDADERSRMMSIVRDTGSVHGMEVKFRTKSGEINDVIFSAEPIELEGQRYLLAMIVDITEKKKIETALKESEERYRNLVESAEDGIVLTDLNGRHLFVNTAYSTRLGYEPDDDPNPSGLGLVHPDDIQNLRVGAREMFARGFHTFDYRIRHRDGRWLHKSSRCTVIRDDSGKPQSVMAIIRDVTEHRHAEERLRRSEADLAEAQRVAKIGSWSFDIANRSVNWSDELYRVFDIDRSEFNGFYDSFMERVHPDDKEKVLETNRNAVERGEPFEVEYRIRSRDGGMKHIREIGYAMKDGDGAITGLFGTAQDISEQKAVEEALKRSLEEKPALLKEVHHRVKNNLQIVASLLSLQANQSLNRETVEMLQETKNRVYSMALLHEALYRSGSLAHVDFEKYLRDISIGLMEAYGAKSRGIEINLHAEGIMLPLEQIVPCGLIINELLTNAFKYAFPDGRKGSISVEMRSTGNGRLEVIVRDDGIGLPKDMDITRVSSLGLKLVTNLVSQLKGVLDVKSSPGGGTEFNIGFAYSDRDMESSGTKASH